MLYFINPSQRGLKPLDIQFIRQFENKVNIVPIIAKADMLTAKEVSKLKSQIRADLANHGLRVYQDCISADDDDMTDPEFCQRFNDFKAKFPFAVIGSEGEFNIDGKNVKGRCYPWGVVDIDDPQHSDTKYLQQLLVSNMTDLQEYTHDVHYEVFRSKCMRTNPVTSTSSIRSDQGITAGGDRRVKSADQELLELKQKIKKLEMERDHQIRKTQT